jgi:N-acetylmuramoyl-L-alanine amidase
MRPIKEIVVHCTATPEGRNHTVADVDRWHKERGFSEIGYHYLVDLKGAELAGRHISKTGAHVQGHNTGTIGIAYVGGIDKNTFKPKDTRTPAQKAALVRLIQRLLKTYPTITRISGHHDYDKGKACPSFPAAKEYAALLN